MNTSNRTPAQIYSIAFGITLLAVGIIGFAVNSSFNTGTDVQGDELIVFEVNGWHNLVHIASGLLGIMLAKGADTARLFALGFGAVYLGVTIYGFVDGNDVLTLLPVNTADNFLHLAIALAGLAAGMASTPRNVQTRRTAGA